MLSVTPQLLLSMPSGGEWMWILLAFGIILIPAIFYLLTLQNTLKLIDPQNRKMDPGLVWLLVIPVFNWIWGFIVVTRISESLEAEYRQRGHATEPKPTYSVGLAMCILQCCSIVPILGGFAAIAGFIMWIVYWVKVNEQKNKLMHLPQHSGDSQIF